MTRTFTEKQRERRRERDRIAYAANSEKLKLRVAERYRKSKEVRTRAIEASKRWLSRQGHGYMADQYKNYGRAWHLKRKYGISQADYLRMVEDQQNRCAICEVRFPTDKLNVDHDHETGRVRGLLCAACNKGIGLLGDDVGRMYSAIEYLVANPVPHTLLPCPAAESVVKNV